MGASIYLGKVLSSGTKGCNIILPTAPSLLLDIYPNASAAYSLRKLRTAYTGNAIRVRRSSDNAEQDFGFVSNVLDTASLLTFCGAGDGFVTTWYDQSGNAKDVTETTAANQPQIVTSGSVELLNGKPMIKFNGTSHKLTAASSIISGQFGVYGVAQTPATQTGFMFTQYRTFSANRFILYLEYGTSNLIAIQIGGSADVKTGTRTNAQKLYYWNRNASNLIQYADNNASPNSVTIATTAANETLMFGGWQDIVFNYRTQNLQECVIYTTDSSSNRTGISSNINTFYTIY
jgi:hypothetical protein